MTNNVPYWWKKGAIVRLLGGRKPLRVGRINKNGHAHFYYVGTGAQVKGWRSHEEVVPYYTQNTQQKPTNTPVLICTTDKGNVYAIKNQSVRVGDNMKDTNERVVLLLSLENAIPYHGGFTRDI